VKKAIDGFGEEPRPSKSKELDLTDFESEVRRLRLETWRIVFVVDDEKETVDVLAVRKRPPYDYGDLAKLLEDYSPPQED
jgi:mRNA interferase RelE/StbE